MRAPARRWLLGVSFLALLCLAATTALTTDAVIKMAREGKSEQAILDAIHDSHASFSLTANDIADLRKAGVSDGVIDAMLDTGSTRPGDQRQPTDETQPGQGTSSRGSSDQTGPTQATPDQSQEQTQPKEPYAEPVPPPVAYPVYPLYYPVYYPVYDPFFPFFGGFFFSFQFIHVSRLFSIFPFDRTVVVVNNSVVISRGTLVTSRSTVFTTPRLLPRGSSFTQTAPMRLDPGSPSRGMSRPRAPASSSRAVGPRAPSPPLVQRPRAQAQPRFQGPRAMPARPLQAPRFQAPRPPGPWFQPPRVFPMPRSGFAPRGGFRSFGSPRAMGGGHGHGGHH